MKTLINVILDESGSMQPKLADVIGGFNRFLAEQQALPDECRLSLVKFNTEKTVVCAALPIKDVAGLSAETYTPGGNTALLDAIAEAVRLADKDKQADERVLCLVLTDGEENSSRETTLAQVKAIIAEREGRGDWTFTYLGMAPEKWAERGLTSAAANNAAYDAAAPGQSFVTMSAATRDFRASTLSQSRTFYSPPSR